METSSRTRRALAGGAVAVALGLGGLGVAALNPLGIVGAQDNNGSSSSTTDSTTSTTAPPTTDATAPPDDHATPPPDDQAPPPGDEAAPPDGKGHRGPGFLDDVLDGLVKDGTLTQSQADAVRDGLKAKVDEWRKEHPGRPGGMGRPGRGFPGLRNAFETAADVIGVEPKDLREGLRDGKSIATIAEEHGKSRKSVIDAIVKKADAAIDEQVKAGHLDADRAAKIKAELPDHVAKLVDATPPHR